MIYHRTSKVFKVNSEKGPNSDFKSCNLWIDYPLLENSGCLPERISSSSWTFWTVWDESLLESIYPWLRMLPGVLYKTSLRKLESMVQNGFRRISRDEFNYEDNVIVVKVLKQEEEPFRPISETTCLEVVEFSFLEERVTINPTPMELIACSGLADILREVYRETDILMIRGSFQRVAVSDDSDKEKIYLLVNASANDFSGDVQLIRFTFRDDATVALIEEIQPRPQNNRYVFKYTAVALTPSNGSTRRRTAIWHQNFRWRNSEVHDLSGRRRTDCEGTLAEFEGPISPQEDAIFAYRKLMEMVPNYTSNMHSARVFSGSIPREEANLTLQRRNATEESQPEIATWKELTVFFVTLGWYLIVSLMWVISDPGFITCLDDEISVNDLNKPTEPLIMEKLTTYIVSIILWVKLFCANCVHEG